MATTITAAPTNVAATAFSNQKHGCTLSEGTLVIVEGDTTTNAKFYYSQNSGTSWTNYAGSDIAGWSNGSIYPYVDSGGTERLVAVWLQSGTGGGRTDAFTYVMVGTFNAGRTTLTWGTPDATIAAGYNYADIVANAEGTGGMAHVAISFLTGSDNRAYHFRFSINSSGVISFGAVTRLDSFASYAALATFPSIDINTADKRLHVFYSAGTTGAGKGIRYRTASYSAGAWTWATEVEVDNGYYVVNTGRWVQCRWDAGRSKVIVGFLAYSGSAESLRLYESSNFTSFGAAILSEALTYGTTPVPWTGGFTIDAATGDIYFAGYDSNAGVTTLTGVFYQKWTRLTTTLGSKVSTDATSQSSAFTTPSTVYPWFSGATIRWVYTKGAASPYTVAYDQFVLNTAPTIAFGASSLADGAFPNTATPTLTAYVTDPDSSQTLTVTFDVATDSGFSSIVYTGTNTAASPQTAGAVSKTTTALSKATLYYWRARVSDGTATSANTATRTFTIYDDPTVTIGASTPATTTSTGGPTLNVGWTYAQGQTLAEAFYRVQVQSNGGGTTYYDTGTLAGPTTAVALDAVALSIPTDTIGTALQVVVTVTAATTGTVVSTTKVFDIQWGVVTVGIVSPSNGAIVATTGITAQWTFASTRGKLQGSYRIRLMIASTGSVLLDTGFVTSAATSAVVGVILVDGSTYSLEVTLKNDQGILGT